MTENALAQDLTRNQALVLDALTDAGAPLSAYSILDRLRAEGFRAPLQVYRALDKLQEYGLVHRLESLNAFIVCSHPDCVPHESIIFAICEQCGAVTEFADKAMIRDVRKWADAEHFHLTKSVIELRGTCRRCAAN